MVLLSSAQTMSGSTFSTVSVSTLPVAMSFTRSTYWRRPTVSSTQASSRLSGLTTAAPTLK